MASGLLHEYVLSVIAQKAELYPWLSDYVPRFGNQFLFFAWNGIVIMLEYLVGGFPIFRWIRRNIPRSIISLLVIATSIPMSHLFTDEYVRSSFYDDFAMGVPLLVKAN